jgi:hypothetical protein
LEKTLDDDSKKKYLKKILSGSSQTNKEEIDFKKNEKSVEEFLNNILGSSWIEDELQTMTMPSYTLSKKEKSYWLLNTQLKTLMLIKSGVELIPITVGEKFTTCLLGYTTIEVPNNLLIHNGWN